MTQSDAEVSNELIDEQDYALCGLHIVMYKHCNMTDNLFGGQMMAWADVAAAMFARNHMATDRLVTVEVDKQTFRVPAPLGWTVKLHCKAIEEGRSSLKVHLVATREHYDHSDGRPEEAFSTTFTFVHVNQLGRPAPWKPERFEE